MYTVYTHTHKHRHKHKDACTYIIIQLYTLMPRVLVGAENKNQIQFGKKSNRSVTCT